MSDEELPPIPVKRGRGRPRKPRLPPLPKPPQKKRGRKPRNVENLEEEFSEYKRCRTCKRPTEGIQDFILSKSGRTGKTCSKCRASVVKSLKLNPHLRPCTTKEKLEAYRILINALCSDEDIEEIASENPEYSKAWDALFNIEIY
jgi:hypothetical protein